MSFTIFSLTISIGEMLHPTDNPTELFLKKKQIIYIHVLL